MLKKLSSLVLSLLAVAICKAQITIAPQIPQSGVLMKSQLWNLSIISTSSYDNVSIILTLSDLKTGEPVLSGTASGIGLNSGVNQLNSGNLPPITYDYQSPNFSDHNPDGFVMAGSYAASYVVDLNTHGATVRESVSLNVEPVSPPMLNTPLNEEIVQTHTPQFTWLPPMPLEIFSYLNYDFKVVEVNEGQNPIDAIQQNIPLYAANQTEPYLNYPSSASDLDTGKTYAWQIIANDGDTYTSQSEVWKFTIAALPPLPEQQLLSTYLKLKKELDGGVGTALEALNAYYLNDAEDTVVTYQIFDISSAKEDQTYREVKFGDLTLHSGQNFLVVPFSSSDNMESGKTYLFELTNSRNEKWNIKFIFLKNN